MKFSVNYLAMLVVMFAIPSHSQHQWTPYAGDANFVSLADTIDKGSVLYHKLAQNKITLTGGRGVLFNNVKFSIFPSVNGSFAWSQVQVSSGKLSFYPHIFIAKDGTTTMSIAVMYNVSRVDPVRGVRTRPSITPSTLSQLEQETMIFTNLKFSTGNEEVSLSLQTNQQETDFILNDYEVSFNYWVKSFPTVAEAEPLIKFFSSNPSSLKLRAYGDKGYLDVDLTGKQVAELVEVFARTTDLYKKLAPAPAPAAPARAPAAAKRAPATRTVTTNKRPQTSRVVKPK